MPTTNSNNLIKFIESHISNVTKKLNIELILTLFITTHINNIKYYNKPSQTDYDNQSYDKLYGDYDDKLYGDYDDKLYGDYDDKLYGDYDDWEDYIDSIYN